MIDLINSILTFAVSSIENSIIFGVCFILASVLAGAIISKIKDFLKKRDPKQKEEKFPYVLVDSVVTDRECEFCKSLIPISSKLGLNLFTKMRIADLVYVPKNHPKFMRWFNKIKAKHIDFILCKGWKPVLLIELDDSTHDRPDRKKRDEFVDKIFTQVNLPLLHIREWNAEELEKMITQALIK